MFGDGLILLQFLLVCLQDAKYICYNIKSEIGITKKETRFLKMLKTETKFKDRYSFSTRTSQHSLKQGSQIRPSENLRTRFPYTLKTLANTYKSQVPVIPNRHRNTRYDALDKLRLKNQDSLHHLGSYRDKIQTQISSRLESSNGAF